MSRLSILWQQAVRRYSGYYGGLPTIGQVKKPLWVPMGLQRRGMFIQTETTPNLDSLKFRPGVPVMSSLSEKGGGTLTMEFRSGRESMASPLAFKLFQIDGVQSVLFGPDFITINKDPDAAWQLMKPDIFGTIMDHFNSGESLLKEAFDRPKDTEVEETDSEVVAMIKELIDTRIRPTIQEDGGDVEYCGFDEGVVKLKLKGACRTCDSSTITLRNGMESMLKHYIPEVKRVEQVIDDLDRLNQEAFSKFEVEKS